MHTCPQCGAAYQRDGDSCAERFSALLALDHSRQEPWGSRHGSAFAAYTLQHPHGAASDVLERCWPMLYRIYVAGEDPQYVARTFRQVNSGARPSWLVPALPAREGFAHHYRVTIADLGDFDAATYPSLLEDWCRATLESFGLPPLTA